MALYLNQDLQFDEVRRARTVALRGEARDGTTRSTSYDARASFDGTPVRTLLPTETVLYRLVPLATGTYFADPWWMPKKVFEELHNDAAGSRHGGGRLFRAYVTQHLALPAASQLCIVEIELTQPVYAWVGNASALFNRTGGMEQVFLPNLANRGDPRSSRHARLVRTYWLRF